MKAMAALVAGCTWLVSACGGGASAPSSSAFPDAPYATLTSTSRALNVEVRLAPDQPPSPGNADVELVVRDANGALVDGLAVTAKTWMPAMGHGSAGPRDVRALGAGRYVVEEVSLPMPGVWELRVQMSGKVDDGVVASVDVQ